MSNADDRFSVSLSSVKQRRFLPKNDHKIQNNYWLFIQSFFFLNYKSVIKLFNTFTFHTKYVYRGNARNLCQD